jgi:hypothetical protein
VGGGGEGALLIIYYYGCEISIFECGKFYEKSKGEASDLAKTTLCYEQLVPAQRSQEARGRHSRLADEVVQVVPDRDPVPVRGLLYWVNAAMHRAMNMK